MTYTMTEKPETAPGCHGNRLLDALLRIVGEVTRELRLPIEPEIHSKTPVPDDCAPVVVDSAFNTAEPHRPRFPMFIVSLEGGSSGDPKKFEGRTRTARIAWAVYLRDAVDARWVAIIAEMLETHFARYPIIDHCYRVNMPLTWQRVEYDWPFDGGALEMTIEMPCIIEEVPEVTR